MTYRTLLRMVSKGPDARQTVSVRDVMRARPVTVESTTSTLDAIELMRKDRLGCLPVVEDGRLVGIVTESDFIDVSAKLLDEWLRKD